MNTLIQPPRMSSRESVQKYIQRYSSIDRSTINRAPLSTQSYSTRNQPTTPNSGREFVKPRPRVSSTQYNSSRIVKHRPKHTPIASYHSNGNASVCLPSTPRGTPPPTPRANRSFDVPQRQYTPSASTNTNTIRHSSFRPPPPSPLRNDYECQLTINKHRLLVTQTIGQGGYSKVYSVQDFQTKKLYAVKITNFSTTNDPQLKQSLIDEVNLLDKCSQSSNVIKLFGTKFSDGKCFMLLELGTCDFGKLLETRKQENLEFDQSFVFYYGQQIFKAVQTVHQLNIVHRDLKPSNFLLVNGVLKLCDFGLSNLIPEHTTNVHFNAPIGTIRYMAPETFNFSAEGDIKVSKPSDIWSCGVILYEMVYGNYPTMSTNSPALRAEIERASFRYPTTTKHDIKVPLHLHNIIRGCLQRHSINRPTAESLLDSEFFNPFKIDKKLVKEICCSAYNNGYELGAANKPADQTHLDTMIDQLFN